MVKGTGRNNGSKGRLLAGWWKGTFGLIAVLGLLMGMMAAQVKSPGRERQEGRERLFEMQRQRSSNALFRSPSVPVISRSRQFSEELVWFKPILEPRSVAFSPDGQFLASPIMINSVGIFRVSDGSLVRTLTGHTDWVNSVSFSPDGSLIASGGVDGLALWRVGAPITNRPPSAPTLISPANNTTVSPTPTFKMKSEDPDGDNVRFEIEVTKGARGRLSLRVLFPVVQKRHSPSHQTKPYQKDNGVGKQKR